MARAVAGLAVLALALAACGNPKDAEPLPHQTVAISPWLGPAVLGDPAAPVEIVEYASTTCSHCAAFHNEELPKLKASHIATGKAKLRYIVLPTDPPALSVAGAAIARCAGQDKYFDVIGDLFKRQHDIMHARTPRAVQTLFNDIGAAHGLSPDQVGTCIEDKSILEALRKDLEGIPESITGTPSFFIGGVSVEENTAAAIGAAVDEAK